MSFWATAMVAAKRAVPTPIQAIIVGTQSSATLSTGLTRTIRNTPAVTIVAAWMSADTGVGPAIASGSHTNRGSWALLPTAPTKSITAIAVAVVVARSPWIAAPLMVAKLIDPTAPKARNIATMKPQSPTRLVTNAFLPALAASSRVNQNEISRYEHVPTPSHPRKVTTRFSPSTSTSIEKANRLR